MNNRSDSGTRGTPRRADPVLGNLDQLDAGPDRHGFARAKAAQVARAPADARAAQYGQHRVRRRVPWWAWVLVVALVGAGVWAASRPSLLASLLPQTQLNALLTRADAAYAAGHLSGTPDSARNLYQAVQALAPDNEQALQGLHRVGEAELRQAKEALGQRDYARARARLEDARSLLGGGSAVDALDQALAKASLRAANLDTVVQRARTALANGQLDGPGGAIALFRKVLAGDPQNAVARHGMSGVGDLLATRVTAELGSNDRVGASKTLDKLAALLPGYAPLPSLRASVAAAQRAAAAQRDQAIAAGQANLRAGRIAGADPDTAEAAFKLALAADPDSAAAKTGLGQVAAALIVQATAAMDAGHAQAAKTLLDHAATLAPQSPELVAARAQLAAAASSAPATAAANPAPGPAAAAKVQRLVKQAAAAAQQGDIMLPPGQSAYDLYRAALGVDGNDASAQAGLRGLPGLTRNQFGQALRGGNLEHAHDLLATLAELDPGDPAATGMRHQLGSAWLDRADRDVRQGQLALARTALQQAKGLVPQDPRLAEIGARIHHGE